MNIDKALNDLKQYILTDTYEPTFPSVFTGKDLESAVDEFMGMIEEDIELGANYLMIFSDFGCSWLRTEVDGESRYWNIDDVWHYWVQLNEDRYFD